MEFKYDRGQRVYSMNGPRMEIYGSWLFGKLREIGCDICTYSYNDNEINLWGAYPRSKIIEIKRFFYDNYPYTSIVEPRTCGLRILFKTKVLFYYSSI